MWVLAIVAVGLLIFGYTLRAHASAPDFNQTSTAAATTTLSYIGIGTGTTTLAYDSMFTGSDSAVLLTQFTASSTSSVLNIGVEYSQDGIDWYSDDLLTSLNSTTTPIKSIQVANTYSWTAAGTARTSKAIEIPTPTRYMRATYSMTGAAGAVWGSIVSKKQQPE